MQALSWEQKDAAVKSFTSTLLNRGFFGQALGTQVTNYAASLGLTRLPEDVKNAIVLSATRPTIAKMAIAATTAPAAATYAAPAPVAARAPPAAPAYQQPAQVPAARLEELRALEQARRAAAAPPPAPAPQPAAAWQPPAAPQPAYAAQAEPRGPAYYAPPATKKQRPQAAAPPAYPEPIPAAAAAATAPAPAYPAPVPAAVAAAAAADGADQMVELEGEDQDQAAVSWKEELRVAKQWAAGQGLWWSGVAGVALHGCRWMPQFCSELHPSFAYASAGHG